MSSSKESVESNKKPASRWTLLKSFRGGHKFFRDERTGKIAIADQSGATPDLTEDGILCVDSPGPHKPLILTGAAVRIGLIRADGSAVSAVISQRAAAYLSWEFGMPMQIGDMLFKACR